MWYIGGVVIVLADSRAGRNYGTVLQAASARGHKDIVILLLGSDADPNFAGACFSSHGERMTSKYD